MKTFPDPPPPEALAFFACPGLVGVTGHRLNRLTPDHEDALSRIATELFADAVPGCRLISGMAEGADTILAEAWPGQRDLIALLASAVDDWCAQMDAVMAQGRCRALLDRAVEVDAPSTIEPDYEALATRLVARSDRLFAVWDGARGARGGTGSVVRAARAAGKPVLHLRFSPEGFDWPGF